MTAAATTAPSRRRRRRRRGENRGASPAPAPDLSDVDLESLDPVDAAARRIGITQLHPEQMSGIEAALGGQDVLMILPTGTFFLTDTHDQRTEELIRKTGESYKLFKL